MVDWRLMARILDKLNNPHGLKVWHMRRRHCDDIVQIVLMKSDIILFGCYGSLMWNSITMAFWLIAVWVNCSKCIESLSRLFSTLEILSFLGIGQKFVQPLIDLSSMHSGLSPWNHCSCSNFPKYQTNNVGISRFAQNALKTKQNLAETAFNTDICSYFTVPLTKHRHPIQK